MEIVTIVNRNSGAIIGDRIEVATTHWSKLVGLMGRRSVPESGGMLFPGATGIHTAFMRTSIDAVNLDRAGRVISIDAWLKPWRIGTITAKTRTVLELPAGTADSLRICAGDLLEVVQPSASNKEEV